MAPLLTRVRQVSWRRLLLGGAIAAVLAAATGVALERWWFGADDAAVAAIERAAQPLGAPLKTVRDSFDGGREAYEARMILVRPDQYVVWTGDAAPDDPGAMWRRVTGRD